MHHPPSAIRHLLSAIRALVFDAYGTLFDVHSVIAECESAFPGRGKELSDLWRTKQLQYTWLRTMMNTYVDFWQVTGEALQFACRALGLKCSSEIRERLLRQYLELDAFAEVPDALRNLRARYKLAILSNGTSAMLDAVTRHTRVRDEFATVWSVDTLRLYKPDPRVYAIATRELKLTPAQIGFVSSNPFDVAGAKNFGFYTIWIQRHPAPFDTLGVQPDVEINDLSELV